MYTALYREFRPETFDDVIGQDHIVKILKNQIERGTLSHSYLFCGTRGTGKTTVARLLAKAVNCQADSGKPCGICANCKAVQNGTFADVIEIDAASNNGVDGIRELRESVNYAPFIGKKKVYIIDEVHMLSTSAFNALLKTLEEPPSDVMFILATTEPQKIPATVLSRCLRLDFRRVSEEYLIENMQKICAARGIEAERAALGVLAMNADGSVRDSLSILEQCIAVGSSIITYDDVVEMLGMAGEEKLIELTADIIRHDVVSAILSLDKILAAGKDVKQLMTEWLVHLRNILITKYIADPTNAINMSGENISRVREQGKTVTQPQLSFYITSISSALNDAKKSSQPRVLLELCVVNMASYSEKDDRKRARLQEAEAERQVPVRVDVTKEVRTMKAASSASDAKREDDAAEINKTGMMMDNADVNAESIKPKDGSGSDKTSEPPEKQYSLQELQDLWNDVINEAVTVKGSFNMLRKAAYIRAIRKGECVIATDKTGTSDYIRDEAPTLKQLIENHTGQKLIITCADINIEPDIGSGADNYKEQGFKSEFGTSLADEKKTDEINKVWSDIIGIKVEIE